MSTATLSKHQKEIDDAENLLFTGRPKKVASNPGAKNSPKNASGKNPSAPGKSASTLDDRTLRKQIGNLEKNIAKLDQQKREVNEELMSSSDPQTALKLHEQLTKISEELEAAETRWAELQEHLEE